jgi:hypothetical protein
MDVLHEVMWW